MRWNQALMLAAVLLVVLLAACPTEAKKKRNKNNKNKNKNKKGNDAVTEWCMKTKQAEKKGIKVNCRGRKGQGQGQDRIVSLSVVGVADKCAGLTAHLFVEMNFCLWTESCTIKKDKQDKYVVKLYKGSPAECITKPFTHFTVSYQCASADVAVRDVLSGIPQEFSDKEGIVRSHEDHPWLYRGQSSDNSTLVLQRPKHSNAEVFVYTIQSLKLMYNDVLKVRARDQLHEYRDDITNRTTHFIKNKNHVTFELVTSSYSTGGEGFVICFKWIGEDNVREMKDACSELIKPGGRTSGMRKKCTKGKKGGSKKARKPKP